MYVGVYVCVCVCVCGGGGDRMGGRADGQKKRTVLSVNDNNPKITSHTTLPHLGLEMRGYTVLDWRSCHRAGVVQTTRQLDAYLRCSRHPPASLGNPLLVSLTPATDQALATRWSFNEFLGDFSSLMIQCTYSHGITVRVFCIVGRRAIDAVLPADVVCRTALHTLGYSCVSA